MNRKSIYENALLLRLMLLFLMRPQFILTYMPVNILCQSGIFCFTLLLILAAVTSKPVSKARVWIIVFYGTIFFTSLIGPGRLDSFVTKNIRSFALCLLVDLWMTYNPELLIDSFSVLNWYIYVNLIMIVVFPDGLVTSGWFLGHKNTQIFAIMPVLVFALIRSYWKNGKISAHTWILFLASAATFLLGRSAGSLVVFPVFSVLVLIYCVKDRAVPRAFHLCNGLMAGLLLFGSFFWLQNVWFFLIEALLQRGASFVWRIDLWNSVLSLIRERPLLGYGYLIEESLQELSGFYGAAAIHPHSVFLFILLMGGAVLAAVVLVGIFLAHTAVRKSAGSFFGKLMLVTLMVYLIDAIIEVEWGFQINVMFVLGMHTTRLLSLKPWEPWHAADNRQSRKRKLRIVCRRPRFRNVP
ncbi:O-antigen ligase family protein [Oscillospiraceae bacterium 44-5]